ncbi:MAG: amidohydrolase family protein [Deltaproteobacteria bacterium]|nr:amidohydrolase family protein [Deltaproteobacteria bacterium]
MAFDLVIRNGMIVDGSGLGRYRADVGVAGDRIAAIGRIKERGKQELDAEGLAVTPGFIDGHTHMDAQIFWDPIGANSCWHGVTTVVMGNCGFTLAPSAEKDAMLVVRSLERAEDISGKAMAAGIRWSWTTFAEYLDTIEKLPKGIHYAANIGHSALRTYAMGERAYEETANEGDLRIMQAELRSALAAGAIGFSTSRTHQHRTSDDRPVASRLAAWSEVESLVRTMGEVGRGIFQYVEDPAPPDRVDARRDELIALSAQTGVPFAVPALLNAKAVLPMLDLGTARGARLFGLAHCRGIGTMSSFRTQLPFDRLPVWRELRALPLEEQRARLADRGLVEKLVKSAHESRYGEAVGGEARPPEFERMRVLDAPLPPNPTVAEAARARGVDPVELMIQLALETDLRQFFVQTLSPFDMDDITAILRHPQAVLSFSDSGAHVSQMADASLQTHLLAHWVRALGIFSFEEAIRMITLAPARAWGFHDRGLVREGLLADLNVLDPKTVAPAMPTVVHDLPAGEKRIEQRATGIAATIVAGQVLVRDGQHTGAFPGTLVRKRPSH